MCIACPPLGNYQQFSLQCKQSLTGIWSWRITGDKSTQPMQWLFPWGSDWGVQKKRQKKGASMGFLLPPRARLFLALSKAPVPLQPFNVILKNGPGKNLAFQGIHSIWFLILVQKKLSFAREPFERKQLTPVPENMFNTEEFQFQFFLSFLALFSQNWSYW